MGSVASLAEPPGVADLLPLERWLAQWSDNRRQAAKLAREVSDAADGIATVQQEILAWARRNPTCPVCGGAIDPEKVLEREHAHA